MLIEHLEDLYRREAAEVNKKPHSPFRASSAGHCERAMGYDALGVKGDPLQPRRVAVFKHGDIIHDALTRDLKAALGDRFVSEAALGKGKNHCEIEGVEIGFHIDGAFQSGDDIGIAEFKSMADYSFDKATKGEIDSVYLCQAWTYFHGTSFNPVVFIAYRKETSHMVEIVFDRRATEKIVTQRLGGDPLAIALNDPLMVTEIRTPFDPSVEAEVRAKFRRLAAVKSLADLAPGVRAIEDELVKVQGKAKAEEQKAVYGEPVSVAGSWYAFATGRKIAGFPCSYCRHIKACLGAKLEIKDGKPTWVMAAAPAEDAAA